MTKFKIIFSIAMIAACFVAALPAYCQDDGGRVMQTVDGRVVSVDALGSKIVIKTIDNMAFSVASDAKIINKDGFSIKLSQVNTGNYIMVDYYDDPSGKHIITDIEIDYNR